MIEISSNTGTVNVGSTLGITKEQVEKLKNPKFAKRIKAWCADHHVTHHLHEKAEGDMPESCMGSIFDTPIAPLVVENRMKVLHEDFLAFVDSLKEETDQGAKHSDSEKMMCDIDDAVEKLCKEKGVKYILIATHEEEDRTSVQASGNIPIPTAIMLLCEAAKKE